MWCAGVCETARTATPETLGTASLSSVTHFPGWPPSAATSAWRPGRVGESGSGHVAAGSCQAGGEAAFTTSPARNVTIGIVRVTCCTRPASAAPSTTKMSTPVRINSAARSGIQQGPLAGRGRRRPGPDETNPVDLPRLPGLSGERRENEADSVNNRKPYQPHGAPRWMAGGSLADRPLQRSVRVQGARAVS